MWRMFKITWKIWLKWSGWRLVNFGMIAAVFANLVSIVIHVINHCYGFILFNILMIIGIVWWSWHCFMDVFQEAYKEWEKRYELCENREKEPSGKNQDFSRVDFESFKRSKKWRD